MAKSCIKCGQTKDPGEFRKGNVCRACEYAVVVAWRKANPERWRAYGAKSRRKAPDMHRADQAKRRAGSTKSIHPLIVLELDDAVCGVCGEDVDPPRYEVDHVVPLSKGGPHEIWNLQVVHPLCNQRKGPKVFVNG